MKKTVSAKFWAVLISAVGIGAGIAIACAGGWDEEYGSSNFSPEVFVDSAYSPFFLSDQFYYKINHDNSHDQRFNDTNIKEWAAYLENKADRAQLSFLLQEAPATAIDSLASYTQGKLAVLPAAMTAYTGWKKTGSRKLLAFLQYLQLAKQAEDFAINNVQYSWDYDSKPKNKSYDASALNRQLQNALAGSTDSFLKERYWFQLLRSYFFNGSPQQVIDLFSSQQKNMPHSTMYYRSLAYTAGAWYKLKDYSRANYYYSQVYAGCDALKTVAHYSFHPQEEKDWNATLALCTNNEEKATLWQMLGVFYADEQRSLKEIYQLNPASDKLDLLLARTVNKYEQKFSSGSQLYTPFDTAAVAASYQLITKIAAAGNTKNPWIWYTAAGYLNTLDEHYSEAGNWFSKAQKTRPGNAFATAQLRLLQLINTVGQAKTIDTKLENRLLEDIRWLKDFDNSALPSLRYTEAFAWLRKRMAEKYARQKDWVKSACFFSETGFYADNRKVEALKTFLGKPAKTSFEQLCTDLSAVKMEDLFEYQAIQLCFADSLDAAVEKMSHAGKGAAVELAGNPFNGRIQDCHDCDHAAPQKIKYSKLSFLQKMKEMKEKIAGGEEVYTNALLLANAHYNITHFGNARFFHESKITGEGVSSPFYIDSVFRSPFTGMRIASRYYHLALQNAANDEQRAKCQYMLAKCQRNQWYNDNIYSNREKMYSGSDMVDLSRLEGFKALKQYANTQYYKEVLKECGYFKTYLGK